MQGMNAVAALLIAVSFLSAGCSAGSTPEESAPQSSEDADLAGEMPSVDQLLVEGVALLVVVKLETDHEIGKGFV